MNWIFHILAAIVVILTLIQILWQHLVNHVFKDGRTNSHKKLRSHLLWLTLVLFLANQAVGIIDSHQKDKKAEKLEDKIDSLNINQTNLVQNFEKEKSALTAQIGTINSNQSNLSAENQKLLDALATNKSIDASTRLAVLDASKQFEIINSDVVDLNAWKSELNHKLELQKIQREQSAQKALEDEKPILEKCYPVFDYTIKRLQEMLAEVAKQNGDTALSTYTGLPNLFSNNQDVAEIKLASNTNWDFRVIISGNFPFSQFQTPRLLISEVNHVDLSLFINPRLYQNQIYTMLRIPGEESINNNVPISDYKSPIDELLRNLVAAQAKQNFQTNQ